MSTLESQSSVPITDEVSQTTMVPTEDSPSKTKSSQPADLSSLSTKGLLRFLTRAKKRRALLVESIDKIDATIREATTICSQKAVVQLMQTQKPTIQTLIDKLSQDLETVKTQKAAAAMIETEGKDAVVVEGIVRKRAQLDVTEQKILKRLEKLQAKRVTVEQLEARRMDRLTKRAREAAENLQNPA